MDEVFAAVKSGNFKVVMVEEGRKSDFADIDAVVSVVVFCVLVAFMEDAYFLVDLFEFVDSGEVEAAVSPEFGCFKFDAFVGGHPSAGCFFGIAEVRVIGGVGSFANHLVVAEMYDGVGKPVGVDGVEVFFEECEVGILDWVILEVGVKFV